MVAVARTVGGLEELDDAIRAAGGSATLVPLDLTDYDGIDRLAAALARALWAARRAGRQCRRLVGPLSPLDHVEPKAWDEVMAVNVTANWQLIRAWTRCCALSDAGRAVFITSGAGRECARLSRALLGLQGGAGRAGAHLCGGNRSTTPCASILFNPGPTRTRMRAAVMPGEDPMTLPTAEEVADAIVPLCLPDLQEHGRLYDFRAGRWQSFRAPE